MYQIHLMPRADKFVKKLKDNTLKKVFKKVFEEISENPYIGQAKKGDLNGLFGYDVYYNKTNYEIAYKVYEKENKIIIVILIGTRENFYNELKRYIN